MCVRCKRWVINSRTQSLDDKTPQQLNAGYLLCAEHFEQSQFMNMLRNSLIHCAVPTIFEVPNPPKLLSSQREAPRERTEDPPAAKKRRAASVENDIVDQSKDGNTSGVFTSSSPSAASPTETDCTPRKATLTSKLLYTQKCLSRARVSLWRNKQVSLANVEKCVVQSCTGLCEKVNSLPTVTQNFIYSQANASSACRFGKRWSQQDKLIALGLFYKSPSAYRFMQRTFELPNERTLRRYIAGFHVTTGFNNDFMVALQQRAESLNAQEKMVVVTFDGMSLKSNLKYLEHDDRVTGFEDLGSFGGGSSNAAQNALQFMVRGISTKWKQPVGHFFVGHSVNSAVLKDMIVQLIDKLESYGFIVCALVCDQEASHRSCLSSLGVTVDSPHFTSANGNVIRVMHDTPHLLKNVRNNLLRYDFVIDNDVITFDHVTMLYDLEQSSVLRFVPKLTKNHIELNNFKKMNVKLAAQVLSHSVACGIRAYVALQKMSSTALVTADFVERMNRLFDIMNSNDPKTKHK